MDNIVFFSFFEVARRHQSSFMVKFEVEGINTVQGKKWTERFQTHFPIYPTLERSAPIEITVDTKLYGKLVT
jgi:hypothetical protein